MSLNLGLGPHGGSVSPSEQAAVMIWRLATARVMNEWLYILQMKSKFIKSGIKPIKPFNNKNHESIT
jgi:hypothetical protein